MRVEDEGVVVAAKVQPSSANAANGAQRNASFLHTMSTHEGAIRAVEVLNEHVCTLKRQGDVLG